MVKKKSVSDVGKKQKDGEKRVKVIITVVIFWVIMILGIIMCLIHYLGFGDITFNYKSGFYSEDIIVEIGTSGLIALQPTNIKYNTNGDDLDRTNQIYNDGVVLKVPESGYELFTITATACLSDDKCVEPKTATYVLGKNLDKDVLLKVININSAWKNLYDYDKGIMVGGATYDYNKAIGNINNGYVAGNYNNRGDKWERDAYMTIFKPDGNLVYDAKTTIGISGGTSSSFAVKSLNITMLSPDSDVTREFRLRSGSQDQFSGNIRSSIVSRLTTESGFDGGTITERVVVFLNGNYYGIFDMQEKFSKDVLVRKYGLAKRSRIEKYKSSEDGVYGLFKISPNIWNDLDKSENREKLEEMIDMDNYLKYFAIQILLNNTDWPMNNFEGWRYNDNSSQFENKYEDGKIRFLLYDTDLVYYTDGNARWFNGAIGDIFEFLMEKKYSGRGSTFSKVMKSEYYRDKFINILEELMNGPFATENVLKIIDEEATKIEHQVELFSTEEEYKEWKGWIELLKKAASERNGKLKANVKKYLNIELKY